MAYFDEESENEEEDSFQSKVDEVHSNARTVCGENVVHIASVVVQVTESAVVNRVVHINTDRQTDRQTDRET